MKYLMLFPLLLLLLLAFRMPSGRLVTGTVVDENGLPLPGATVQLKQTAIAVSTDASGRFSLQVKGDTASLIITCVGFLQQEILVGNTAALKVVLYRQATSLAEIAVTGFASVPQKRALEKLSVAAGVRVTGQGYAVPRQGGLLYNNMGQEGSRFNTEGYSHLPEHPFVRASDEPLSTFSIDVDAASYSNVRRMLTQGQLPPAGAVRIEEMINYFSYHYPAPVGKEPFQVYTELARCPWNTRHALLLVGLQGKRIADEQLPASNLVFLVDVSGSMDQPNKLPLVKASLRLLAAQLRPQDKVSIVVYAGRAGLVLPATGGRETGTICSAIDALEAGGSTAGGEGIQLAYRVAREHFVQGGNNRVILCTDGDFNVGLSSEDELVTLVEQQRSSGIYLTVLGYGTGNYQDSKMQQLADKGNGNHAYIDQLSEAKKVLIREFGSTLFTIAKDVKLQVEMNPALVQGYRLIGYENRMLAKEDFKDDRKDAGELGSGHSVTALYEIIPAGAPAMELRSVDPLRYGNQQAVAPAGKFASELLHLQLRYKLPEEMHSRLMEKKVDSVITGFETASGDLRFAAVVAAFGMQLRHSAFQGNNNYTSILHMAQASLQSYSDNSRVELVQLIGLARNLEAGQDEAKKAGAFR